MRFSAVLLLFLLSVWQSAVAQEGTIAFADTLASRICVERWDRNGDGRLSLGEAAAVRSLGGVFCRLLGESPVSLDELKHFTSLRRLGFEAFTDCYQLRSITLPPTLEVIDNCAFWSCVQLEHIQIPPSVHTLEASCFYHCKKLEEITTPTSVRDSIPLQAFAYCISMRRATIGEGPKVIGPFSFYACISLQTISLPSTIQRICVNAFGELNRLRRLVCHAPTPPHCEDEVFSPYVLKHTALYVPAGSAAAYKAAPGWRDFQLIVELLD